MIRLLKSYKTEIDPTEEQKHKINRTIGVCRFIYNFYIAENKEIYEAEKSFMSGIPVDQRGQQQSCEAEHNEWREGFQKVFQEAVRIP